MQRVVKGSPATLSATFAVDEVPTDLDAAPTVSVKNAGGSQISSGTATRTGPGVYTYTLPAQSLLSILTITWTGARAAQAVTQTTYAEIVGGNYFTVAELRNVDSVLTNTTKYPTSKLISARLAVESEFEDVCERAFVPRYSRETIVGNGTSALWLGKPELMRVIWLEVDGVDWMSKNAHRPADNLRVLTLDDEVWPRDSRIVIEYEYGMVEPPIRVKNAAMKRAKYGLVSDLSRIDERATTMNVPDFGNFVLATPGMRGSYTGIPEVDVVLQDYALGQL